MSQYADPLDFVKEVRRLADRITNLETRRPRYAGPVSSGLSWAMATGWSMSSYAMISRFGIVDMHLSVTRSGGPITVSAFGDADETIGTVPDAWRPIGLPGSAASYVTAVNTAWRWPLTVSLNSGGSLALVGGPPSITAIDTGHTLRIHAVYAVA